MATDGGSATWMHQRQSANPQLRRPSSDCILEGVCTHTSSQGLWLRPHLQPRIYLEVSRQFDRLPQNRWALIQRAEDRNNKSGQIHFGSKKGKSFVRQMVAVLLALARCINFSLKRKLTHFFSAHSPNGLVYKGHPSLT